MINSTNHEGDEPQVDESSDNGAQLTGTQPFLGRRGLDIAAALGCSLVAFFGAVISIGARPANLGVSWGGDDALPAYAAAKAMLDNGWWTPNPDLGYPYVQDTSSFPTPDWLAFLIIKIFTMLTDNPFSAVNLYFLVGFPATALAGYLLFRYVRISIPVAAILATSFALLPWHFGRFVHVFLANYSFVLIGLLAIAIILRGSLDRPLKTPGTKIALATALTAAVIAGLGGTYMAFFTTIVGGVGLLGQILAGRGIRSSIRSILVLCVVPVTLGLAIIATGVSSVYRVTTPITRGVYESEMYGGQIYSLFRIAPGSLGANLIPEKLRTLTNHAVTGFEGNALNNFVSFAAIIVTAILLLTALASTDVFSRAKTLIEQTRPWLLLFSIALAFFVSTGLGSVFAATISPSIRAWGRLAVVVVAIAMVILGIALTIWQRSRKAHSLFVVVLIGLGVITVLDPIAGQRPLDTAAGRIQQQVMTPYVERAEQVLAPDCPVLEVPITLYPEAPAKERAADYSGLIPYLYSTQLRWSYGALKFTDEGKWLKHNLDKPPAEQVELARQAGFCALQLDMYAFPEAQEADIKATYQSILGPPISTSSNNRWVMFNLN